jgi:hypothetical protein
MKIGKMGSRHPRVEVMFIAHSDAVVAHKGRLCATREFRAELDASRNWIEVCSDFSSIFRIRELSQNVSGLRDASENAAARSGDRGKCSASARGLKNYAQKRNEQTLMRCVARRDRSLCRGKQPSLR